MSDTRSSDLRPLVGLLVFLVLWWLVPPVVKGWLGTGFYQFQAPVTVTASQLHDLQTYWELRGQSRHDLIEAGRDLARINAQFQANRYQAGVLGEEVARLEALLRLPSEPDFRYEVARVARRDLTAWWQELTIRKGHRHGIVEGAAVVFAGGVVGRIREVHATTSVVELITSPGFRMAATLEGEDYPVTYQGLPNAPLVPPFGEVLNVPPEVRVDPGRPLLLMSSRLGGVFPQGLVIGTVVELKPGRDGYFQRGKVRLDPELTRLQEVAVIVPLEPDNPEAP